MTGGKAFPPAPTAWGAPHSAGAPATPRLRARRFSRAPSVLAAFLRPTSDRAVPAFAPESHPSLKLARSTHPHAE